MGLDPEPAPGALLSAGAAWPTLRLPGRSQGPAFAVTAPPQGRASPVGDWATRGLQVWTGVRNTLVPGTGSPFTTGPGDCSWAPAGGRPVRAACQGRAGTHGAASSPRPLPAHVPYALCFTLNPHLQIGRAHV